MNLTFTTPFMSYVYGPHNIHMLVAARKLSTIYSGNMLYRSKWGRARPHAL